MKKTIDWEPVFLYWLSKNLDLNRTTPYTYNDLAKRFDIAHKTIRNRASKDKWQQQLNKHLAEQTRQIITKVQAQEVFSEAEVRTRHARIARLLLDKALTRMEAISPDDISHEQASRMIVQCIELERKALGLVDKKFEVTNLQKERAPIITVDGRKAEHESREVLAAKLLEFLQSKESSDTECT